MNLINLAKHICLYSSIALFLFFGHLIFAQSITEPILLKPDPYVLFEQYYQTIGGLEKLKQEKTSISEGTIQYAKMHGKFRYIDNDMRYYQEEYYPAFSQFEGDDGKQMWSVDLNHKKLIFKDPQTLKRRKLRELLIHFEHINKDSSYFTLRYVGSEYIRGEMCDIVELNNSVNDDIYFSYFSQKTSLLVKQIVKQPYLEISSYYSDFRKQDNMIYAFHEEIDIAPMGKKIITQTNTLKVNVPVDMGKFSIPSKDVKDFIFRQNSQAINIPFLFIENSIYLPVTINDKTHYWVLDSGADMSVIDHRYAEQLELPMYGKLSGNATSSLVSFSFAKLNNYLIKNNKNQPALDINKQIVLSYKGLAENFYEPEAIGILGYDFLSRFITKVDFAKRLVSFYDPENFTYQGAGTKIDAPLQNKLFMLPMTINERYKGHFGLDLGSYNVSLNYHFAQRHGLLNEPGVKRISSDISGVFEELQIMAKSLKIADYKVEHELYNFPLIKSNGTNSDGEMDGLLGNSLLRHFVLYLDYTKQQIIIEKGDNFNHKFPQDHSGMIIGISQNSLPEIFYIAEQTPAQKAGLKIGDIIVSLNGQDNNELPGVNKMIDLFKAEPGTIYRMKILRDQQLIAINLTLEELFSDKSQTN